MVANRVEPSDYQKTVLERLSASTESESKGKDGAGAANAGRKKRRAKGPNPLSVKKSTKMRSKVNPLKGVSARNKVCQSIVEQMAPFQDDLLMVI